MSEKTSRNQGNLPGRETVVEIRDLVRRFGDFVAVDHVSLEVSRGEIFGFLGPNGAGKSTTIRMLCGLLEPSEGIGRVAGFDIRTERHDIKASIGYMSQKFSLYDDLTVTENVTFFGGVYGLEGERLARRREWVLAMAGLEGQSGRRTGTLPGGVKQRLALGCALLHEPPILFLDEPTSGVDPNARRRFWDLIHELATTGVTVFVTTHYMEEAEYCDRLALVYRGRIIALGTPGQLKREMVTDAVLAIDCPRPQDAMEWVASVSGVRECALFGKGLHAVAVRESTERLKAVLRVGLEEQGFAPVSVEPILPSLEDVFVSLIEERDREEQPRKVVKE